MRASSTAATPLVEPDLSGTVDAVGERGESVTFVLPPGFAERHAELLAEFACWAPIAMDRRPDGSFAATVRLARGGRWHYQFAVDGRAVINDPRASRVGITRSRYCSVLEVGDEPRPEAVRG